MPDAILTPLPDSPSIPLPSEEESEEKKGKWDKFGKYIFIVVLFLAAAGTVWAMKDTLREMVRKERPGVTPTPSVEEQTNAVPMVNSELSTAHNKFGLAVLKEIYSKEGNLNIFISPSSISLALSMVYNGANGETQKAMEQTLELKGMTVEQVDNASLQLMNLLKNPDPKVEISIANSIWARKGVVFNPDFLAVNQKYYQARVESLDFNQDSAVETINQWVFDSTRGKIPSIVGKPIPQDLVMFLINAIYFKGTWTYEFSKDLTLERDFFPAENSPLKVPMMEQQRKDFLYLENNLFQAVSLPYGENKRLRMLILLPKEDLAGFLEKLNLENWDKWRRGLEEKEGTLILPKFKIEYEKELKETLSALGMEIVFDSFRADFSKLAENTYISFVKHKTYVDVNEEGTEAAAVTSVGVFEGALPNQQEIKTFYMEVNRPFFFAIEDRETQEVLFMGIVNNPKS